MSNSFPVIFNRELVKQHRKRAAPQFAEHDFLLQEMAQRLGERLDDFHKTFPAALDLGAHSGLMHPMLNAKETATIVQADLSEDLLRTAKGQKVICDEERLPFADNVFDLVISAGSLHWVNDLLGALIQIRKCLKPGGLFLAIIPGGETLKELRHSMERAEMAVHGGVSPRISPFIDVRDGAGLLQRAGFEMPVADSDMLTVQYTHPLKLMHDLRGMGEANALFEGRKYFSSRKMLAAATEYYAKHFTNADGRVDASFELVTLTGLKPR